MKAVRALRGLPSIIWALFAADLVNNVGYFVLPFLTILLTDRLGMGSQEAGLYLAMTSFSHLPGTILGGKLADHIGRKRTYIWARLLAACTLMSCALLGNSRLIPWMVMGSIVASSATEPAISAMVADVTSPAQRQTAYSLVYLGRNLGFAIGPVVAGLLYGTHSAWLFVGDGLTSIVAAIVMAVWIRETLPSNKADSLQVVAAAERPEQGGAAAALVRRPWVVVTAVALAGYSFAYVQCVFGLPLQMHALFSGRGAALYGALMSANALSVVVLTAPLVRLTACMATTHRLVVGGLAYAVGFGSIFLLHSVPMLIVSTVIWSAGEVLVQTNSRVLIADNSPSSHRGRFNAAVQLLAGGGYFMGPLLGGALIENLGLGVLWKTCFVVALISSALMLLASRIGRARLAEGGKGVSMANGPLSGV